MSKYSYPVVKLSGDNILRLWDGPHLTYQDAIRLLKKRRKADPDAEFYIYRDEHQHNCQANAGRPKARS